MSSPQLLVTSVRRKRVEAQDIASFELVAADGEPLPPFSAGAHIDVHVMPSGPVRQYSLCNHPSETHRYVIGVLRDPASRGGSAAMHERINEGDTLTISAPKNHFSLAPDPGRSILLAGGIGVTPILCMAQRLAQLRADFEMHYCTRSEARTAFRRQLRESGFASRVRFHFDDGPDHQKLDLDGVLRAVDPAAHLYVCGPKGFMDAALGKARTVGWPEDQLHYEFFTAGAVHDASDASFAVKLARSGHVIQVGASETVVQALASAGVTVPTSCEQGVCGTCLTRVLAGEPDHRDLYLTRTEQNANDCFLPCCSRAKTPELVLDL